jgi:YidC/Oxa1 family membrane protein insertase
MFLQLPIFIGLYRALSVDIELRQTPLISGLEWCSNLAAPDMLWRWDSTITINALTGYTGFLGPYLNLLPMISTGLFLVHQQLFTPPPTDEQQEMQQKVMKFMMLFMLVLFFKVPAGLCLYFITSSLWALAERVLLPKDKKKNEHTPVSLSDVQPATAGISGNGKSNAAAATKKKRRKRNKK